MFENQNSKHPEYDLEERTLRFAKGVRLFVKTLPRTIGNQEDGRQLIRSPGSMGANYREANDAISKKDFFHRIKISRKESKETIYWLTLVDVNDSRSIEAERGRLQQEARKLMMIFSSIMCNRK